MGKIKVPKNKVIKCLAFGLPVVYIPQVTHKSMITTFSNK